MWLRVDLPAEDVLRFLGIAVELPEQLGLAVIAFLRPQEAIEPAVAAAEDHLRHAAEHRIRRATTTGRAGCSCRANCRSKDFAGVLVEAEEARGVRRRDVDMIDVDAVRGVDEQDVADGRDRATAHVVLRDAELLHHVERPDARSARRSVPDFVARRYRGISPRRGW